MVKFQFSDAFFFARFFSFQWRSHIGAIGAAAPVENFLVTFPIRPDPLSFFKKGGGEGERTYSLLIFIAPYLLLILIAPVGIKSWLRYCAPPFTIKHPSSIQTNSVLAPTLTQTPN